MSNFLPLPWLRRGLSWLPAVLLALPALAQVDTYQFAPSTGAFAPLPAVATDVPVLLADDQVSGVLPLGFSFVYDGTAYTTFLASSNGFLSFNAASGYNLTNTLSTASANTEKPLVAPLWDDLDGREPTARASYQTTGAAPNQVFTFEWLNWKRYFNTGAGFSMQVKLYQGSGRIEFVYRHEAGTVTGASASIGLAGPVTGTTPSDFLSLNSSGAAPIASGTSETSSLADSPATGQIYTFLPPTPSACPTPRGLTGVGTSATSASLSWTVAAGTGPFTVQYGPAGFNPALPSSGTNAYTTLVGVTGTSVAITGLTGGGAYQFFVTQVCGGAAGSSARSNGGSFILNDEPCGSGALTIANTCTPTNGTTQGATTTAPNGYSNPSTVCSNSSNNTPFDVWYSFTTAATGPTSTAVRIRVSGAAEMVRGFSGASCTGPFAELGCVSTNFSTPTTPDLDLANLLPSTTYYVAVSNASSFQPVLGPFTICATPVPNCPEPSAFTTGTLTNTTAQISWSNGGGGTGSTYTVTYGLAGFTPPVGGTVLTGITTTSTTLTALQPNTAYEVYIQQICGGFNGSSTVGGPFGFATPLTVPTNDDPCGAIALGNGTVVSSTNVGSTTSLQNGINLPACSPANAPKDVWFSFTAAQTASALTLTGTAAGMVRVFTAPDCANGPFVQLVGGCASSGANNTGVAGLALTSLTAGQRYYVAVSGYGSSNATGTFTLSATNVLLANRTQADTEALLVYPNPSNTGHLTLRLASASGVRQAVLFNSLGQIVLRETLTGATTEHSFSTRALPTGLYTLRVSQGQQTFTRKVVLE